MLTNMVNHLPLQTELCSLSVFSSNQLQICSPDCVNRMRALGIGREENLCRVSALPLSVTRGPHCASINPLVFSPLPISQIHTPWKQSSPPIDCSVNVWLCKWHWKCALVSVWGGRDLDVYISKSSLRFSRPLCWRRDTRLCCLKTLIL